LLQGGVLRVFARPGARQGADSISGLEPNFVPKGQESLSATFDEQCAVAQHLAERAGIGPVSRRIFDNNAKLVLRAVESQVVAAIQGYWRRCLLLRRFDEQRSPELILRLQNVPAILEEAKSALRQPRRIGAIVLKTQAY